MLITCDGERVKQQFWEVKLCEIYDRQYKDMIKIEVVKGLD